jgi:hypothetical protein
MKPYDQDPKYMLEHKDEFEQLEYGNLEGGPNLEVSYFATLFNGEWSYCDTEANSKEGWIKIIAYNVNTKQIPTERPLPKWFSFDPYLEFINDNCIVAKPKLYGNVIIFKIDPHTLKLIKKR